VGKLLDLFVKVLDEEIAVQFGLSSTSYILFVGKLLGLFLRVLEEETAFWIVFYGKVTGLVCEGAG
jgi:hypothetical protein